MQPPLVVGFDLDLTLIDSRPGIAAAYRELSSRSGVYIDADAAVTRLGPPLEEELARWFPADQVTAAVAWYREIYPEFAVVASPALPGAAEAFAAVRAAGGRVVVITGKYEPNARLHLDHLGLAADAVVGWVWAEAKTVAMTAHRAGVYVGDHPADMAAALAVTWPDAAARQLGARVVQRVGAQVAAVGVLTGDHAGAELVAAGAHAVLRDLTEFPAWLAAHLHRAAHLNGPDG
ncbi:MAG TPA: haloacid dehalogenase-like hydrolase [Micromonosporaceae bacterium]